MHILATAFDLNVAFTVCKVLDDCVRPGCKYQCIFTYMTKYFL